MKCFIASAFDHDDVDDIYDHCIVPALRKLSVTPLRVDRVKHNEDVDKKIFELIDSADFAIADLTYARPSVYYEAGYAAGQSKPVIYIAKYDHFRARDDDLYGNFRVHFDLQMKNIISWRKPDHIFANKLLDRVRLVIRPLERVNRESLKLEAERSEFSGLPMLTQLRILEKTSLDLLRSHSFQGIPFDIAVPNGTARTLHKSLMRFNEKRSQGVRIIVTSSASKQLLQYFSWGSMYVPLPDHIKPILEESHYIVASLKPVPRSRITEALADFRPHNKTTLVSGYQSSRRRQKSFTYVHIIDGIKSGSEFKDAIRTVIDENGLTNGA